MGLYLVESFKGANIFGKLAFIFLLLAEFIGWVAYCTGSWGRSYPSQDNDIYAGYGVWRYGRNAEPGEKAPINTNTPEDVFSLPAQHNDGWLLEWYGAFQAFATFGFICLNVGFFLVILFMFVAPCKSNSDLSFWNAINNIFGSVCWLIAVVLFGAFFDDKFDRGFKQHSLHYSFGFAIVTFALQLAAGIVLLLTGRGGGAVRSSTK